MSLFWIFRQIYVYFRQLLIIWNIENRDLTDKYLASIITFLFVSSVLNLALILGHLPPANYPPDNYPPDNYYPLGQLPPRAPTL